MRICIIHGYLLTGTGSNIFVSNLARSICQLGHDILLFCQEKDPGQLDFVNTYSVFSTDNSTYQTAFEKNTPYKGRCTVFNPDINGLLPVYVYDRYKGFEVKTFTEMETSEVEEHIHQNVLALETIYKEQGFDAVLTNHVIISPSIAREIGKKYDVPYFMTLHGSALNFIVRKDSRFEGYATDALLDAKNIFAVSEHNRREAVAFFKDIGDQIEEKFKVIPTGVDTNLFDILNGSKQESIDLLKSELSKKRQDLPHGKSIQQKADFSAKLDQAQTVEEIDNLVLDYNRQYEHGHPDENVVQMLDSINWDNDWIVLFVGKYLWTKGIQVLLCALPFILKYIPNLQLVLVGFGSYREELEALVHSLDSGRSELFRSLIAKSIAQMGPDDNPEMTRPFKFLEELTRRGKITEYFDEAQQKQVSGHVHFLGVMSHNELSYLLPCADELVATSIFPEAFGTVAIEAMACGVLPVVSNHTGFKEIIDLISDSIDETPETMRINMTEDMVFDLAAKVIQNAVTIDLKGQKLEKQLRQVAVDNFSWDIIAERYAEYFSA